MRLLLIRHGQTRDNVLGQLGTAAPGPALTKLGIRQAAMIPDALRSDQIDAIFASTLQRTRLTAEPLARDRGLDIEVRSGVHEIEAGSLEMRSDHAAVRTYLETAFAWGSGDLAVRMPGGPDGHAFFARYDAEIESIAASGVVTAVVFSHGAAIRVWTARRARNIRSSFAGEHELENTGVVVLDGSPDDGWELVTWAGLPIGGPQLIDQIAEDPTGESLSQSVE